MAMVANFSLKLSPDFTLCFTYLQSKIYEPCHKIWEYPKQIWIVNGNDIDWTQIAVWIIDLQLHYRRSKTKPQGFINIHMWGRKNKEISM